MRPPLWVKAARLAGKAALALACLGGAALAQPEADGAAASAIAPMTAKEDLYLAVFVNEYDMQLLVAFHRFDDGCLTVAPEDLKELRLKIPESARHGSGGFCLEKMPGVTYRYDAAAQAIHLKVSDSARIALDFDLRRKRPDATGSQPLSGLINYSVFASVGTEDYRTSPYPQFQGASATVDGHLFSQYGYFDQSFKLLSTTAAPDPSLLRLDTHWLYENPDTLVSYSAGDIISGSLNWTTSLRMGGVQIKHDFSLRPDLVTMPLPQYSGSAAVPSALEVFASQTRAFSQEIAGGPFNINNIPMATGPGTMRIVLRDAAGKETVTEYSYYNATTLLVPDLFDYSVETGFARRFYGLYSDNYDGEPIASGSFRYGVTPRLTVEGHAEGGAGLASLGAGADFGLWHYGVASLAATGSEWNGALGGKLYSNFETTLWDLRLMLRSQHAFGEYEELANVTAPKCTATMLGCVPGSAAPNKRQDLISLSIPLKFDPSSINLSFSDNENSQGTITKIGTVAYSRKFLWDGSTISVNAFNDFETKDSYGAYASLIFSWDKYTASAIAEAGPGTYGAGGTFSRRLEQEAGSYGYSVTATEGTTPLNSASASYRAPAFLATATVQEMGKTAQATAQVDGAVAVLEGVHFANRIDNSFAVVDTGLPDSRVLYQNNAIGQTDSDGKLLIPMLRTREENLLSIDPGSLPVTADMPETKQTVVPGKRGGMSVHFKSTPTTGSAVVNFKDGNGAWLPAGSEVWLNGGETAFVIGYDGEAYLTGLAPSNTVSIKAPDGSSCNASFAFTPNPEGPGNIPGVVCAASAADSVQTGGITVVAKK